MEDRQVILSRMLNSVDNKYDKTEGSFFYDALGPAAIEFEQQNQKTNNLRSKLDIENLNGLELERFIKERTGISRKQATKATTIVKLTGQEGAGINVGDLVASETLNYIVQHNEIIGPDKEIFVLVECEALGTVGNVPVRAIKYFPITISGLNTVVNLEPVTNGYDAESDEDLLQRYYERIKTPATSGNQYHYMNWTKEVAGVGDARVLPLWDGNNTVKVIIIDSNKQPANHDLVASVQDYIDPDITGLGEGQAPIGAYCTVASATGKEIDITFTAVKDINYTLEQVETSVGDSITEYLKSIAFKESLISYAKIGATVLASAGVLDYSDLKINNGTSNITIADQEVAILGEVVISE